MESTASPDRTTLDLRRPIRRGMEWLAATDTRELVSAPGRGWWQGWGYGDVTGRMVEAFVLGRRALARPTLEPEEERTRQFLESLFDSSDGLSWRPETEFRRRAAHMFDQSSVLFGLVVCLEESGDPATAARIERMADGLSAIAEWHGDWCRYPLEVLTPSGWVSDYDEFTDGRPNPAADPCHEGGRQIMPLVHYFERSGHEPSLRLAEALARFVVYHSGVFEADGSYLETATRATGHVHSRLGAAAGILQLGRVTDNPVWENWAKTVFDWTLGNVASSFGWISERAHSSKGGCETCCITDALDLAIGLARSGYPEYWDVADRFVRNHLLESQCVASGGFSGHTRPSDFCWIHSGTGLPEHHVGGCCSPAGIRGLWLVWDASVSRESGVVSVHLPLVRQSPWVQVTSDLPWEGRVEVTVLDACDLMLRIPGWVATGGVRLTIDNADRPNDWRGRYLRIAGLSPGERVVASFPVRHERRAESFMDFSVDVTWRGHTVLAVDPLGDIEPLYQRNTPPVG